MKYLFYLLCLSFIILPSISLKAKTLHAILVADTVHEINSMTVPDLGRWQKELRLIAQHTKMLLQEKVFSGQEFDKAKLRQYLDDLRVKSNDSVVFYFSGHGYRTYKKTTPWPFITFEYYKPGIDVQWIAEKIKSKKPQFALVMTDCCNNFMENGMFGQETKHIQINLHPLPVNPPGYEKLFCRAKGCIVISSCGEGEFAYGSRFGGLYTHCFFTSLNHELSESSPSWKNLLQRANVYIQQVQTPVIETVLP